MKDKKTKATLKFMGLILISIIIVVTLLIPFNLKKLLILFGFLFVISILYKLWNIATYGFVCLNCGYEFQKGIIKRLFREKRCPVCSNHELIKESFSYYYFKEWSDLDED
ncbi:hypothetical protein [Clostridium sp. B9]|uniref:hypothetical protein n=1 Tax=Clostridium sp. B9 TaxID=3423224 RepID=UPI003D2EAA0B